MGGAPAAHRHRRARRSRGRRRVARTRHRFRRSRSDSTERARGADANLSRRRDLRAGAKPSCNRPRQCPEPAMNIDQFGMDTITLAGPLEAKLRAVREAGFTQIMLQARDIAGHPNGESAAVDAVKRSGLRVTGFQVLRDFEGLSGHLHAYKVDIAKAMLEMCRALGSTVLLACSSSSAHASGESDLLVKDLQKLATLAVPLGIRIAYEA